VAAKSACGKGWHMTEQEAIETIREQLVGEHGLIARLQRGDGIDREAVHLMYDALAQLERNWADRLMVPKYAVFPMVDIFSAIRGCTELYPGQEVELDDLAMEMVEHIERVFYNRDRDNMSEEEAMALVYGHLIGLPTLALALHHREKPHYETLEELRAAIHTLAKAWAPRDQVPKFVIGYMLEVRDLIAGHAPLWPADQQRLDTIAVELKELVQRCLQRDI
jgi:hypothetical protein